MTLEAAIEVRELVDDIFEFAGVTSSIPMFSCKHSVRRCLLGFSMTSSIGTLPGHLQNQLIVKSQRALASRARFIPLSLFGYYTLNYANSNTGGAGNVPSIPGDISADYGRAAFDVRHRVFFGGTIGAPHGFRLSPFMIVSSGIPFNITTGQDVFGDAQFNSRPAFGTCGSTGQTSVVQTAFGCFDTLPQAGQAAIPVNYATGPDLHLICG